MLRCCNNEEWNEELFIHIILSSSFLSYKRTHLLRAIKSDKVHYLEYAIDLTKSCKICVPTCKLLFKSTVRDFFFVVVSTST